jgi:hypothetical protein
MTARCKSGVLKGVLGVSNPQTQNSKFIHFRVIYIRKNIIRIRVLFICKVSENPDFGANAIYPQLNLLTPEKSSWCKSPEKYFWVSHCDAGTQEFGKSTRKM